MLDAPDPRPPDIEAEFSPENLLARYARGRVAHVGSRQVLTMAGGLTLTAVEGLVAGVIAMAIALAGELVDCLLLARVPALLARGMPFARLSRLVTATATLQAMSIAACVLMAWFAANAHAPLFALAFLAGAAVNAGIVLPFHRGAALSRLMIYAITLVVGFSGQVHTEHPGHVELILNASGAAVLVFLVHVMLNFALTGTARNRQHLLEMAEHRHQLEVANHRLRRSQKEAQRLALVARLATDSVLLLDAHGRITWVNDAFTRITGYPLAEAAGQRPGDLLNGPETSAETIAAIRAAASAGRPFRGEIRNRIRDGTYVWIDSNQVPVLDADGRPEMFIAVERDVTEARRVASDLARAKDRAEAGARVKAEFLANMSHEIRTPMNGITGMAELLCDTDLTADQRLYAETIHDAAQSLLGLIDDILDLSRLDAGKLSIVPADFDLRACLDSVIAMFRAQAGRKGLSLTLQVDTPVPRFVTADDTRLRQILVNLIGNAIKFTQTGGVDVTVRLSEPPDRLAISVTDSGIGIAPDHLDHIFQRFSQAESDTTRRFGGSGLGLTISHMLANSMGGTIEVRSSPGVGSCFTLSLPLVLAAGPPAPAPEEVVPDPASLAGRRVLVAEDNQVNRLLVQRFLHDLPVTLHFARNGREAVEMTRSLGPDIVLMDMSMPEMNGIEATRAIRGAGVAQPAIVALTANAFEADRAACLAAGMDGFLTKPVRRAELVRVLAQYNPRPGGPAAH